MRTEPLPKYTSIGCYPLFYINRACECLCPACADEDGQIRTDDANANWEDPDLFCDACSDRIESAYAEPDDL